MIDSGAIIYCVADSNLYIAIFSYLSTVMRPDTANHMATLRSLMHELSVKAYIMPASVFTLIHALSHSGEPTISQSMWAQNITTKRAPMVDWSVFEFYMAHCEL